MPSNFVHLHVHSQYSLLEGALRLKDLCAQVAKFKMPAVALTDSGNLFGAYEFYEKAKAASIKPIFGAEVYYLTKGDLTSRDTKDKKEFLANLVLLAKDEEGYKNLCELLSLAHLKGFYYKPRLDRETLAKYSRGLIALSGTMDGEIHQRLLREEKTKALEALDFLINTYQDDFYLELQDHSLPLEARIKDSVASFIKETNVPVVATNDCHYLKKEQAEAQIVLECIKKGWTLNEALDRGGARTEEAYLKSSAQMQKLFSHHPEALANSLKIAEACNFAFESKSYHLPQYQVEEGKSLDAYLEEQAFAGLEERWPLIKRRFSSEEEEKSQVSVYEQRLKQELKIISEMGFPGYFLIVADFIHFAKEKQIPVGPGRGSGAGSLTAYCLKIVDLDPLAYNLLFERFLNPERISMPDMDIDFCIERRDEVIEYVREKYGFVAQIITFGTMKAKAVVRDVGRVLDMPYGEVDRIAKLIPNTLNITLEEAIKEEPRLKDLEKQDPQVSRLLQIARSLEGLTRHASMHAAGVVIADKPLPNFCPLYKGPDNEVITQFDMKSVESIGLIKFDFLGLKTLTVIDVALKIIERTQHKKINLEEITLDDEAVYQTYAKGDGLGVFQVESSGFQDFMTKLKPSTFEDIIALLAIYRPGPLGSGMVDDFIERRHGRREITYDLDILEPILKPTYGVIVYQEQVMQIASALANFTLGDADLLRRAMGKKKPEEMAKQKEKFLKGAAENKVPPGKAKKIFDLMAKFAEYGFNKSHSAAYALVSYYTAYLKTHFTVEYMASLLTHEMGNTDKILIYIQDCREHNLQVLPPDINESFRYFSVTPEGQIRFGLAGVKGVGDAAINAIVEERKARGKFISFFEFCERVDLRRVNKKVIESLIKCGALDVLHKNRAALLASVDEGIRWGSNRRKDAASGQHSMFELLSREEAEPKMPAVVPMKEPEKLKYEKEVLGFYISGHPLKPYQAQIKGLASHDCLSLKEIKEKQEVSLCGVVSTLKEIRTKRGKRMAFLNLEDLSGQVEVVVFSELYERMESLLKMEEPLYFKGQAEVSGEEVKILAEEGMRLEDFKKLKANSVHLRAEKSLLDAQALARLKKVVERHSGTLPLFLHLVKEEKEEGVLKLPPELQVDLSEGFIQEVEGLLGQHSLVLK